MNVEIYVCIYLNICSDCLTENIYIYRVPRLTKEDNNEIIIHICTYIYLYRCIYIDLHANALFFTYR